LDEAAAGSQQFFYIERIVEANRHNEIAAMSSNKCEGADKLDILPFACDSSGLKFAQRK
jgi:hypothetical protein